MIYIYYEYIYYYAYYDARLDRAHLFVEFFPFFSAQPTYGTGVAAGLLRDKAICPAF